MSQPFALRRRALHASAAPAPSRFGLASGLSLGGAFLPCGSDGNLARGDFACRFAQDVGQSAGGRISVVIRKVAEPSPGGREVDALRRIERLAGVHRTIALRLLPVSVETGNLSGSFARCLLWPQGISRSRLSDAQMEAILAHEVCHVRRGDNITAILHMAVEAIFWFHPLVWWLEARLVEEREGACDERGTGVLRAGGAYAESILKVCEFLRRVAAALYVRRQLGPISAVASAGIVTARALLCMTWPKKLLLGAAAVCVLAVPVALGQAAARAAHDACGDRSRAKAAVNRSPWHDDAKPDAIEG